MADKFSKLPFIAKPSTYDLHFKPCLETFKCPGTCSIALEVLESTKSFQLYASELDIQSASLELSDGKVLDNLPVKLEKKWDLLTVDFPDEIKAKSNVKLNFKFCAEINNVMQGLSRSHYKDKNGEDKFIASTQFESTYARRTFPCWDEPIYKAVFNIALEVSEHLTALSNMNVVEERKLESGKKYWKFAPTPIMSTYLVAFAIGELEYVETKSKGGILIRVYTLEGNKKYLDYALDIAAKCFDFYDEWFDIKCTLPKCDLIAIPDFSMGAMENWGLITYRELLLFVDPVKTSTLIKSRVSLVIAHEIAHFWFGNLVTMKWWTDLWLKEGFASFMMYLTVSYICPELKIFNKFLKDEIGRAFNLDCMRSSHAIEMQIENPNELEQFYDAITYMKSNSVLRMLYLHLGEPTFQKGLRIYLKKHQYSNTQTIDLWEALTEASGEDINAMMSSWTKQMNFPVVSVQQRTDGEKGALKLYFHQERFISDGSRDELESCWQIPISVITASSPQKPIQKSLLKSKDGEIILEGVKPDDWIKVNVDFAGFYRVQYTNSMLEAISSAILSKQLSVADRYSVVSDLIAFMKACKSPISQFLQLVGSYKGDDEYILWSAIDEGLATVADVIEYVDDRKLKEQFNTFVCEVLEPLAQILGWESVEDEDLQQGLFRTLILSRLVNCNHAPTIKEAKNKFKQFEDNNTQLEANLRYMIFLVMARTNERKAIDALKRTFEKASFSEVERDCAMAIGGSTDVEILKDAYKYFIYDEKLRPADFLCLFSGTQQTRIGKEFIWDYFKQNSKKLVSIYGSVNHAVFHHVLRSCIEGSCSGAMSDDVMSFMKSAFDEDSLKSLDFLLKQATESIRLKEKLVKSNVEDLRAFFKTSTQA